MPGWSKAKVVTAAPWVNPTHHGWMSIFQVSSGLISSQTLGFALMRYVWKNHIGRNVAAASGR